MEISDLPDKEFKVMVIKMLTQFRIRMDVLSENFNKVSEKKKKLELNNTITDIKMHYSESIGD